MALSTLINTSWKLNNVLNLPNNSVSYNVNFIIDETEETGIELQFITNTPPRLQYQIELENNNMQTTSAYTIINSNGLWFDQKYRTITITGGTDATNSNLITWLQTNATRIGLSLSKIKLNGTEYNIKDATAREALDNLEFPEYEITTATPNAVGTAIVGEAETDIPNYTPSGDINYDTDTINIETPNNINLSYNYSNYKLYFYDPNTTKNNYNISIPTNITFDGNGVQFAIQQKEEEEENP